MEHPCIERKQSQRAALPEMFERYQGLIQLELSAALPSTDHPLYGMLRYHMGWVDRDFRASTDMGSQGKSLRPTLCLFAYESLSANWQEIIPAAVALELIHNFSLIHDDIQDGDFERHHRPTIWTIWGRPSALIAGNLMRGLADIAFQRLMNHIVGERRALKGAELLSTSYLDMIQGQCLDISFENRMDISLEEYLGMVSRKTGALIKCSMELGAILATDNENVIAAFGRCGSLLGQAFQIQDDILGIWGDEMATGKSSGNDILRKKKTFPIVHALQTCCPESSVKLSHIYSKPNLVEEDVQHVLSILTETEARQNAQQTTQTLTSQALDEICNVGIPKWAREEIEDLVTFLNGRQY